MNTLSSSSDITEALPRERHRELLAVRYQGEDQLGINPLKDLPDDATCNEKTFRNRVVELPQRSPTKEQFALMLQMGDALRQSAAAIDALRLYAHNDAYPSNKLALEVLATRDKTAAILFAKYQKSESQRIAAEMSKSPDPVVPVCCHDPHH